MIHYSGNARQRNLKNDEIKMAIKAYSIQLNEEVKLPKDDLNWVKTGGSFGKKRRFPTLCS